MKFKDDLFAYFAGHYIGSCYSETRFMRIGVGQSIMKGKSSFLIVMVDFSGEYRFAIIQEGEKPKRTNITFYKCGWHNYEKRPAENKKIINKYKLIGHRNKYMWLVQDEDTKKLFLYKDTKKDIVYVREMIHESGDEGNIVREVNKDGNLLENSF